MSSIKKREKDFKGSAEKESLKGSRKDRLLERARKKERTNDIEVSNKKNLTRFWNWKCVKKIAACDHPVPLGDHKSSCQERTPVIAAGFQLEGNLCHFNKLHNITQHVISHVP